MDKNENFRVYVWTGIASGLVGLLVGITALMIQLYEPYMLRILLSSILAGTIIGVFCRALCLWLIDQNCWQYLWFIILGLVGIGTAIATACIGGSFRNVIVLVAVAEILGLTVAYANYRQFLYVNEKLCQKREKLRHDSLL